MHDFIPNPNPNPTTTDQFNETELHILYNACMLSFACMDRENEGFAKDVAIVMKKIEILLRMKTSFFDLKRHYYHNDY